MSTALAFEAMVFRSPQDTQIRFKNSWEPEKTIPVRSQVFALYCPRIAALLRSAQGGVLPIEEPFVSVEHFVTWVKACQYEDWQPTLINLFDLEYLSQTYGSPSVAAELRGFVTEHGDDCLIPRLLWNLKLNAPTAALEQELRGKLATFVTRADILDLPLHVLDRIVRRARGLTATAEVRAFLNRALEKWGPKASRLGAGIDLSGIAAIATDLPGFDEGQLRSAMGNQLCELKLGTERLKRRAAAA
jgi:hypothetical protein